MKRALYNICFGICCIILNQLTPNFASAQDSVKSPLVLTVSYFSKENQVQYLTVNAKSKVSGKFQPVKGAVVNLFLGKDSTGKGLGSIGKVLTDEKGKAVANIPLALAQLWKSSPSHLFFAVAGKSNRFDEATAETSIAKSRIVLDTAADKIIMATFSEFKGNEWGPVKGVEIKLGIKRLGADLLINEEQSYTTDSLGHVKGEFKRVELPGDVTGNIILVAKVEDNDQYGNLRFEKAVPWGTKAAPDYSFFHRALWASQFHSPVWLIVIAYGIIISVWGTIIYLLFLLIKIRKLGSQEQQQ